MPWLRLQQALLRSHTIGERALWLVRLRWLAVLGMLTTGLVTFYLTPVRFHLDCVFGIAVAIMAYNSALYFWARRHVRDKAPEEAVPASRYGIHLQIVADLVCLTILIQCTGGLINPFLVFMVFHMAIAGIMLPREDALLRGVRGDSAAGDHGASGRVRAAVARPADRLSAGSDASRGIPWLAIRCMPGRCGWY